MKILFATDGSNDSEMAARILLSLGLPSDAEVVIQYVIEPIEYLVTPAVPPTYRHELLRVEREMRTEAEEASARAVEQGRQIFSNAGINIDSLISEGHPAEEIIRTADKIGADLVVIGAKGLTGNRLFKLGSVSQRVVKYASCSVLLAQPSGEPNGHRIDKVLLATDGSEYAFAAVEFLSSFSLKDSAEVVILHVIHKDHRLIPHSRSTQLALEQLHQLKLENAERMIEDTKSHMATGLKTTTLIREGDPAEQILKVSSEISADLIVMGSKGLGGVKLFILGSVSQKVLRHSDRSVLLVKLRSD